MDDTFIVGAIIGGLAALILVPPILVGIVLLMPRRACPECGALFPKFRVPRNAQQMLWGGMTCAECGCAFDRKGKRVESGGN